MSAIAINKGLVGMAGSPKSVKKLRSGDLLVEMTSARHSELLLRSSSLADLPITVTPHNTLNSSRGVVVERELINDSEEDILAELEDQGVTAVRRIRFRKDGSLVNSRVLILTFNSPRLPSHVTAAYLSCEVRPYVPNPLRCFQCQRYGHSKISCRGLATCAKCALQDHETDTCSTDSLKCVNCSEAHPAYSRSCPKWKEEKQIQEVRTHQNISYPEARRLVAQSSSNKPSYASMVKATVSVSVQTDISVPPSESFAPMAKFILKPTNTTADQSTSTPITVKPRTTVSVLRAPSSSSPPPKPTLLRKPKKCNHTPKEQSSSAPTMECDGYESCSSLQDLMDIDQARALKNFKQKFKKPGPLSSKSK